MHHMYPLAKGDALCPLGFHPQVRWPTRCKRCFRDYKEHGGKRRDEDTSLRRDDTTVSTPSLSSISRNKETEVGKRRSWVSSSNLANDLNDASASNNSDYSKNPSSWISTPDLANLEDDTQAVSTTVSIKLPRKKQKPADTGQPVFNKSDGLAARAKKLKAIKEVSDEKVKRIQIKEVKTISEETTNNDVQFLIQVKTQPKPKFFEQEYNTSLDEDNVSLAGTETTDTTLVDARDYELHDQLESIRKELEMTKTKCDRLEREKSDILLRRLAAMETITSKTTATEALKLQHKCNELQQSIEDYRDEKKSLSLRVRELEDDLEKRPTAQMAQKMGDELRSKLLAAETLCEELMDENEDIKKELRDMEEQMDEMQDNFREDQVVEYSSLKKELDQTKRNGRILAFKLKATERKFEQAEQERNEAEKKLKEISGGQMNLEKMRQLEQDLKLANEVSSRLQKELDVANEKQRGNGISAKKKAPMLASIGKFPSADTKVSRESLTRGGSQDDPVQLLRDLQDSIEREADLREQLKFAEEEAQSLRKTVSRIEDDNESLVLQLKKMATRDRSRKLSPNGSKTSSPQLNPGKNSEDDDPAEIKLQLELSEHEATLLRRKFEDLESENQKITTKYKELQEKVKITKGTAHSILAERGSSAQSHQKVKILEDEANDLRKKLIEKERDCERLHAELSLNKKRSKTVSKPKSLEVDENTLDLKRQLQVIEQEANILRTKVQSLETENEKLLTENKKVQLLRGTKYLKSDKNLDKYIDQIASLEIQIGEKDTKIQELQDKLEGATLHKLTDTKYKRFADRTPKKISNLTSKDQLKTMVHDLENEIGEMLLAIKTNENENIKLTEDIKNLKIQIESNKSSKELLQVTNQLTEQTNKLQEEKLKTEDLNRNVTKTKDLLTKSTEDKKKLKDQIKSLKEEQEKISEENRELKAEITKLKTNLTTSNKTKEELTSLTQKSEDMKVTLQKKEEQLVQIQKELEEKSESIKELSITISTCENKAKENDEKMKKNDKIGKDKLKELQYKIDEYTSILKNKDQECTSLQAQFDKDRKSFHSQISELQSAIENKNRFIQDMEERVKKEREALSQTSLKTARLENRELNQLKDDLKTANKNLADVESKLHSSESNQKQLMEKIKKYEYENDDNKRTLEKKIKELELELQTESKKLSVLKTNNEKEKKSKQVEISSLTAKIKTLELNSAVGTKQLTDMKQFQESIEKLNVKLNNEKQKYDDLTAKYEILEEEHVVTKAKLVMEKETIENQLANTKSDLHQLTSELKTLRDTYNKQNDAWIKEKLEMQDSIKSIQKKGGTELEKVRLKASLEEKHSELEQFKKEHDVINDQLEYMRKENDELRRKLDDYEKVNKIQRNISADSTAMDKEMRQLRTKLVSIEKSKKLELGEYKMRYDNQMSIVNGELQLLQGQIMRFKRERDTYKHMLESAQKAIGELKHSPKSNQKDTSTSLNYDELEESKNKVATLEQQISCMEDELSEARLEGSRLKTELVSEKSSWEIKLSELHSRVNELEEEKILNSGRTKIVGLRTRMELAWQKEREEQQRLLQETATLARDLRQTLFEVERERDKERLEAKRKQDQVKKSSEEDQDENKKKITELQCDLLELRDAHAKLRTTNEKLRREKDRYEREREEMKSSINGRKKTNINGDKKVMALIEQVESLKQAAPEELFSKGGREAPYTPTPPRRIRSSKSRETSPALDRRETSVPRDDKQQEVQMIMHKLINAAEDLRHLYAMPQEEYDDRFRMNKGFRRATSTETESVDDPRRYNKRRSTDGNLHRKSISLEHSISQNDSKIWKNDDSMSSLQSLDMGSDVERWSTRDASLDSRLSGGSTQSDFVGEKKKKKGLLGKLKKLTKSRSIDDQDPGTFSSNKSLSSKPNSNSDITEEKGSKKDLKGRLSGIFKKSGSSSRSNSVERPELRHDSSTQRPLMKNESERSTSRT